MTGNLHATLLSNTGLLLRCGASAVLVDALNQPFRTFKGIPEETAGQMIRGEPPFDRIDGLFYTHLHPDHYDQARNTAFLERHPGVASFLPTPGTPDHGTIKAGAFTLEYHYLEHIPCDYPWVKHYVFLLSAGGVTLYLSGDASLDPNAHRAILAGRRPDYGFFNALYLSYPETRVLLCEAVGRSWIYHLPEAADDGIRRKAARNLARYPEQLRGVAQLDRYPCALELPPVIA